MSMLENIKAMVARKNSMLESRDLLLGDQPLMESLDDSIILSPFLEAEEAETPDIDTDTEEEEDSVESEDDADTGPEGDVEIDTGIPMEDDPLSDPVPDDDEEDDVLPAADTPDDMEGEMGEEPLPLPGDDLPEPIGAQTGEPVNTDDDIMSLELGMGSDTPRDVLPIPPANAADAIADDPGPMMQGVDSGFGGNTMSAVGPMDGSDSDSVMDMEMDAIPDSPEDAGETGEETVEEPAEDLSMESVEERIKKDVEKEERHKAKVADAARKSAAADEQFGENYLYDMAGHPITESEDDDLIFDPFGESCEADTYEEATPGGKRRQEKAETVKPKTEGYSSDYVFDPFNEAIELGGDNQNNQNNQQQDNQQQQGTTQPENEVTAAVKDKVQQASGGQQQQSADDNITIDTGSQDGGDAGTDDLGGGGLDFGSDGMGDELGGGDDLGGGAGMGGNVTELLGKQMQNMSKIITDVSKMQAELAQQMAGL